MRPRAASRKGGFTCGSQGEEASAELAADYTDGALNGPDLLASVNRVIALRQSLK